MVKQYFNWIVALSFFAVLVLALTLLGPSHVKAQPQEQYPILDRVADKVIQKYQPIHLRAVVGTEKQENSTER